MDLHKYLKSYEYNDKFYQSEGIKVLFTFLADYRQAHKWFHYYVNSVEDSNPEKYAHYIVTYWSNNERPTTNIFNFIKESNYQGEPFND